MEVKTGWWEKFCEMMDKFWDFLDDWNKKCPPVYNFPVYIGSNGYSICDEVVNTLFAKLGNYWNIFYFEVAYDYSPNVVTYQFRVYEPQKSNADRRHLLVRARQVGEKALTQHLHAQGIYNLVIDNFVAVTLQADVLRFYFATTSQGFAEIVELRKRSH